MLLRTYRFGPTVNKPWSNLNIVVSLKTLSNDFTCFFNPFWIIWIYARTVVEIGFVQSEIFWPVLVMVCVTLFTTSIFHEFSKHERRTLQFLRSYVPSSSNASFAFPNRIRSLVVATYRFTLGIQIFVIHLRT